MEQGRSCGAVWAAVVVCVGALWGCGDAPRTEPVDPASIWEVPEERDVEAPIDLRQRTETVRYGLPREGQASIADLIAIFPSERRGVTDPDIFAEEGFAVPTDQCRGGAPEETDQLPMVIEGVVTLHPRQYMKVTVCGQDERNYGSFTIEDDTGGIVVLRDSRVAPFSFGDRVRLRVHAAMLTFGADLDTRAVLAADIELLPSGVEEVGGEERPVRVVLYQRQTTPWTSADVAEVRQIEGWVYGVPTNENFNAMVVADQQVPDALPDVELTGPLLQCTRTCETECRSSCISAEACSAWCTHACVETSASPGPGCADLADDTDRDSVCAEADNCPNRFNPGQEDADDDGLGDVCDPPVCWQVGLDSELGRRRFQPQFGQRINVTGPVVNSFGLQMWVISTGQVEFLDP